MGNCVQPRLRRLPLAIAVVAAFQLAPAFAQDQAPATGASQMSSADQAEKKDVKQLESVMVTGTLLKRPEYQEMVPVQSISIEANQAAGSFGTVNLLQTAAVAMGSTQINNQFSGFVVGGGTGIQTIDLRGLGANRTLVLLDGQRPGPAGVQGQTGSGFDLNVVPEVILGNIEIVKDGSSSIYGSDAISGVVNMITKKRVDGTHMEAFWGVPQHGGGQVIDLMEALRASLGKKGGAPAKSQARDKEEEAEEDSAAARKPAKRAASADKTSSDKSAAHKTGARKAPAKAPAKKAARKSKAA